jgi:Tfp pilus assembly protein PilF
LIERALSIDPDFPPAIAVATQVYVGRVDRQLPGVSEADRHRGLAYARRGIELAANDAHIRATCAFGLITLGAEFDTGMLMLRRAAIENPNNVILLGYAGIGALHGGTVEEAAAYLLRAIRLYPNDYGGFWLLGGMAHVRIVEGKYDEALDWATRAHAINSENNANHWLLAAVNAHMGRMSEAIRWREALQALLPETTIARIRKGQLMKDPRRIEIVLDGLRLAGLPES